MKGYIEIGAPRMGICPSGAAAMEVFAAVWRAAEQIAEDAEGEMFREAPVRRTLHASRLPSEPLDADTARAYVRQDRIMKLPVTLDAAGPAPGGPNCAGVKDALVQAAVQAGAEPGSCEFTCRLCRFE